eukprot:gnl/Spiro4/9301_TR4898_c0_g3_i1.p1 gnl/Spiro4/9301_TR4898_c0_g3~~gnl/Spiro4/9301_TR4898_c0_g3_i1.p1  ORF type:complete len:127 (+),score=27.32 gnl/Spiro4/9301_TR4898_c0_g3_i1:150-530(+)
MSSSSSASATASTTSSSCSSSLVSSSLSQTLNDDPRDILRAHLQELRANLLDLTLKKGGNVKERKAETTRLQEEIDDVLERISLPLLHLIKIQLPLPNFHRVLLLLLPPQVDLVTANCRKTCRAST